MSSRFRDCETIGLVFNGNPDRLDNKLVDALALTIGSLNRLGVEFGGHSQIELSGERLLRFKPFAETLVKIFIHGFLKRFFQFLHAPPLEHDTVPDAVQYPMKACITSAELGDSTIPFVSEHVSGVN